MRQQCYDEHRGVYKNVLWEVVGTDPACRARRGVSLDGWRFSDLNDKISDANYGNGKHFVPTALTVTRHPLFVVMAGACFNLSKL